MNDCIQCSAELMNNDDNMIEILKRITAISAPPLPPRYSELIASTLRML